MVTEETILLVATGTTIPQTATESMVTTTIPAGAFIFIDWVQRGVKPANIPEISAEAHVVLLKLDEY